MNPVARVPYAALGRLMELAAAGTGVRPAAARKSGGTASKLWRTVVARRSLLTRYEEWGTTGRDQSRPLLWVHAPSVGEGLMALPVVQQVRRELPDVQLAYTFFSPSAEAFAPRTGADFTAYLPFDTARAAERVLNALRPTALVFSKLDVWPLLAERAHRRGVKVGLISASMPAQSPRRGIGRVLTADAYAALDLAGAVSADDARYLIDAGVAAGHIRVTGDTRYDQAWERAHTRREHEALVATLRSDRPTVVAGSTWAADEAQLLPAWEQVVARVPEARLVIAPHEIDEAHVGRLEAWAARSDMRCLRLRDAETAFSPDTDVILVDRIGVLADLYALADVAYVGGGFHDAGLHSVVEPAVVHTPVVIGPRYHRSRDARMLLNAGGGITAPNAVALAAHLHLLLTTPSERQRMAAALETVVSAELGAAARSFELVRELL